MSLELPAWSARDPERQGGCGGTEPVRAIPSLAAPAPGKAAQQRGVPLAVAVSAFPTASLGSPPQDPRLWQPGLWLWLAASQPEGNAPTGARPFVLLWNSGARLPRLPVARKTRAEGPSPPPPSPLPSPLAAGAAQLGRGPVCVRKMWAAGSDLRGRATGLGSRRPPPPPVAASIDRALKRGPRTDNVCPPLRCRPALLF